jgi:hypothetical protein
MVDLLLACNLFKLVKDKVELEFVLLNSEMAPIPCVIICCLMSWGMTERGRKQHFKVTISNYD